LFVLQAGLALHHAALKQQGEVLTQSFYRDLEQINDPC
jgi:hypothetical protein